MNLPSLFGWLDNLAWWRNLSYPIKGALIRAAKAALSVIVGILLAAATDGILLPEGTGPITTLIVTMVLQSVDKFLRETEAAKELGPEAAEEKAEPGQVVNTDATVIEDDEDNQKGRPMAKILYHGDAPVVDTGFGIVAKNLLNRFTEMGHEVSGLGINWYGDPYDRSKFNGTLWPCDKGSPDQIYGYAKFWAIEEKVRPDIIFLLNDPWVIERLLEYKPRNWYGEKSVKIVAYYPTDAEPMQASWVSMLDKFDAQVCYSKYAEEVVTKSNKGKRPKNLHQVYHGVDTEVFKPVNMSLARRQLHLPEDAFIVGMVARNQYRKRFDIMCQGFAEFAKDKPEAKLYLHTAPKDVGFDIADLVKQFDLGGKIIITKDLINPSSGVPEKALNMIYNTFDVNCLISLGDGFGLPVAESMAAGVPQVVSGHSCLKELVEGHGGLTVDSIATLMNPQINTWGLVSDYRDLAEKLNIMYNSEELRKRFSEEAYEFITQPHFTWDHVAQQFNGIFNKVLHILDRAQAA